MYIVGVNIQNHGGGRRLAGVGGWGLRGVYSISKKFSRDIEIYYLSNNSIDFLICNIERSIRSTKTPFRLDCTN